MSVVNRPTVSLCMIVRNEAKNLEACVRPVARLFDEIVIVDTGSNDNTMDVARGLNAKVSSFTWADDFSAARNAAVAKCTSDYIFWLDADDRMEPSEVRKLDALFQGLSAKPQAYMLQCVSKTESEVEPSNVIPHLRLFPRVPEACWEYRVHEQILPSLERAGIPWTWTDIAVQHTGYLDPALLRRKSNRDLRLLRLDYLARPDDPIVLYHLGVTHMRVSDHNQALGYFLQALQKVRVHADWVRKLYSYLFQAFRRLNRGEEALAMTAEGLSHFPDDQELLLIRAEALSEIGSMGDAENCLNRVLKSPRTRLLKISVDDRIARRDAQRLLACVYLDTGRDADAETLLQKLLADHPDFTHGWVTLGYLYFNRKHFNEVEYVVRQLHKCPSGDIYAMILQALVDMERSKFDHAKDMLDQAISKAPSMIWPRAVLGDWYLRNNSDLDVCLAAQRDILRIDPGNLMAQQKASWLENRKLAQAIPTTFVVGQGA